MPLAEGLLILWYMSRNDSLTMIRLFNVRKIYQQGKNQISALAGVSLQIPEGEFAVIMGASGSGKSTLLHLMGGLDHPTDGDVMVAGRIISQMPDTPLPIQKAKDWVCLSILQSAADAKRPGKRHASYDPGRAAQG